MIKYNRPPLYAQFTLLLIWIYFCFVSSDFYQLSAVSLYNSFSSYFLFSWIFFPIINNRTRTKQEKERGEKFLKSRKMIKLKRAPSWCSALLSTLRSLWLYPLLNCVCNNGEWWNLLETWLFIFYPLIGTSTWTLIYYLLVVIIMENWFQFFVLLIQIVEFIAAHDAFRYFVFIVSRVLNKYTSILLMCLTSTI